MKANIILERAADYIVKHGHRKDGRNGGDGGPACVYGAIGSVVRNNAEYFDATEFFRDKSGMKAPSIWNDAPERTADDVILALRRAARSF